eukprot:CAMPEP_0119427778 /NCGR_PEP_ID=MMETSP1335-20130426/39097_1 /TAXON_ID=259385 /ORGANISM="Chrysoculter rhomboideus, Strain RCC1486" /LENGTH=36 /DNA_ID= /DNA_START= /DNA_END= /DNA_ORIENTATION=
MTEGKLALLASLSLPVASPKSRRITSPSTGAPSSSS